jgi:sugar fermentation stimulation protein A
MSLVEAKFLKREKRFFAYCRLPGGEEVIAHCPNSGSMKGNKEENSPVWLQDFGAEHPGRKLRYKWVLVESGGRKVVIDTLCANGLVADALRSGAIAGFPREFQAEKKIGDSRLDFYFPGSPETYLEVKSVSMGEGDHSSFPDAVTERGQKHLKELVKLAQEGKRAVLLFLITRENSLTMSPADAIDPEYGRLLRRSMEQGLEVLVYGMDFEGATFKVGKKGKLVL